MTMDPDATSASPPARRTRVVDDAHDPPDETCGDLDPAPGLSAGTTPTRPPFTLGYRPELDGLRGFGMLIVLFAHAGIVIDTRWRLIPGGTEQGVDIFFVLSGFLITTLLLDEYRRNGRISFTGFYTRRILRLIPTLLFVLGTYLIYTAAVGRPLHDLLLAYVPILLYISNYVRNYSSNSTTLFLFGQTWSLSIEEQYYLVFFPLLALGLRYVRKLRRILVLLACALVIAIGWRAYLNVFTAIPEHFGNPLYYRTDTRLDALIVGPIIAVAMALGVRDSRVIRWAGVIAVGYVTSFLFWGSIDAHWMFTWGYAALEISWAIVLLWLMTARRAIAHPILEFAPVVWIGRISYEIYLWHLPVFYEFRLRFGAGPGSLVAALAVVFLLATITYYGIARPFLKIKQRRATRLRGDTQLA